MTEMAEADFFLGRQVRLRQLPQGHRAGTDAVLLAAAAPVEVQGLALDVGAGGSAPPGWRLRGCGSNLTYGLIENDPATAALARENLALNDMAARGRVYEADVSIPTAAAAVGLVDGSATLVITNPPFLDPARSRLSPDAGKRAAHAMPTPGPAALAEWLAACLDLLLDGGLLILIHAGGGTTRDPGVARRACGGDADVCSTS